MFSSNKKEIRINCSSSSSPFTVELYKKQQNNNMSDGRLEKMDKDFSPQVDALLPETEGLAKVRQSFALWELYDAFTHIWFIILARKVE